MKTRLRMLIGALLCVLMLLHPVASVLAWDTQVIDPTVSPGDNFYDFATGGWQATNPQEGRGATRELDSLIRQQVETVVQDAAADPNLQPGSDEWKVVQYYQQGIDMDQRNTDGIGPVQPVLDDIAAIETPSDAYIFQGQASSYGLFGLYRTVTMGDLNDSSRNALWLLTPRTGLSNPEYYLSPEAAPLIDA